MRLIAHRGLINGTEGGQKENHPAQIDFALTLGYDAEIDVWCLGHDEKKWYLGHDGGINGITYEVPYSFLLKKNLWIHCKNLWALEQLAKIPSGDPTRPNFFWHEEDSWTITSHGKIWMHIKNHGHDVDPDSNSVVMVTKDHIAYSDEQLKSCYGVCSKYVEKLKERLK